MEMEMLKRAQPSGDRLRVFKDAGEVTLEDDLRELRQTADTKLVVVLWSLLGLIRHLQMQVDLLSGKI